MICDTCGHKTVCGKYKSTGGVDRCKNYEKPIKNEDAKAVARQIERVYEQAKKNKHIRKPMAYALYKVWKIVDGGK